MPNLKPNSPEQFTSNRELEATTRILDTIHKQIEDYRFALKRVIQLREEINSREDLAKQLQASPEALFDFLKSRGIAEHLSAAMAAEEFKTTNFRGGQLGLWTWDCCCSDCCFTCWSHTCDDTNHLTARGVGPSYKGTINR